MSYADKRKERAESETNTSRFDFSWEERETPLLHSGFTEPCSGDETKSVLFISIWFANGSYRCRIQDRQADEKAFFELGTLQSCFTTIEAHLNKGSLDWTPDRAARNGK